MNAGQIDLGPVPGSAGAPSGAVAECVDVDRCYVRGGVEVGAVRGVSCAVEPGLLVALTGPSGSGKTTLLHLLAGLDRPTGGVVAWPGLGGTPEGRPGVVGVVFQGPSLIPTLDVLENVTLPLLLAGVSELTAIGQASAALDRVRVGGLAGKLPEEISGGQAQRVAIARVLASRPRLILADEPTGQLDRDTGVAVVSVLLEVAAELGAALVVSTHDPAVACRMEREWRMDDGLLTAGVQA